MRRWLRSTGEETFADYQRRVVADLFTLADQFRAQGIPVHAIAVPFGDYGQQDAGNDPRVVPFTLGLMETQFGTVFVQDPSDNPPFSRSTGGGPQERWEAHRQAPRGICTPGCAPMIPQSPRLPHRLQPAAATHRDSTDSRSPGQTQP